MLLITILSAGTILSCGKPTEILTNEINTADIVQELPADEEKATEIPKQEVEVVINELDEAREAGKSVENIFFFDSYMHKGTDENRYVTALGSMEYSESERAAFIKNYLQSWDMYKEKPDGVVNGAEKSQVDYYLDESKRMTCFVVHMWFDSWVDYEGEVHDPYEITYCAAVAWEELEMQGSLSYESDEKGKVIAESLYGVSGDCIADISYEYMPGIVFPFIVTYQSKEEKDYDIEKLLNRNNKFWLYRDWAETDKMGVVRKYKRDIKEGYEYDADILCTYNKAGRLEAFLEQLSDFDIEMECEEENSGEILFRYNNNNLDTIDYHFCMFSHGTWDSSGKIHFDEQNRMVYRECYVTHGTHYWVYLYEEDEVRPKAIIYMCKQPYSWKDDGSAYDVEMSAYFFTPELP